MPIYPSADRPLCSGKHKKHGVNVQVLTDLLGRLLWASPAPPGAVHDIRAARTHGLLTVGPVTTTCRATGRPEARHVARQDSKYRNTARIRRL